MINSKPALRLYVVGVRGVHGRERTVRGSPPTARVRARRLGQYAPTNLIAVAMAFNWRDLPQLVRFQSVAVHNIFC